MTKRNWSFYVTRVLLLCTVKTCEKIIPPDHGSVTCTRSNNYGSTCSYSCDLGYQLNGVDDIDGTNERSCQDDETWSGTAPTCQSENKLIFGKFLHGVLNYVSKISSETIRTNYSIY